MLLKRTPCLLDDFGARCLTMLAAPRNRSRANHDVTEDDYHSLMADWKKSLPGTMADAVGPVLCSNTCQVTPVTFMRLHQLFTLLLKYGLTSGVLLTSHLQSGLQKTMPEGTSLVDITKYRDHIQHNFTMLRWYSQHSSKASARSKAYLYLLVVLHPICIYFDGILYLYK